MSSTPTHPLRLGMMYDFRRHPDSTFTLPDLYRDIFEQARLVDELGFDVIWLSEHHFVPDGYLPSIQPVAGALLALTKQIRVSTDVALAPFIHPLRLAEDLGVLDNIGAGRMEIGLGMGYAPHEFDAFGMNRKNRVSLLEECIEIVRQAGTDSPVNLDGKRYRVNNVNVFPKPVQPGGIPLWVAAQSEPGVLRAAKMGLHLLPQGPRQLLDIWRNAVAAEGRRVSEYRVGILRNWIVTDDPQQARANIRAGEMHRIGLYQQWHNEAGVGDVWTTEDRIPQGFVIGNEEEVLAELTEFCINYGITDLLSWPGPLGILPSDMNESIRRFAEGVAPRLRAAVDGARSA